MSPYRCLFIRKLRTVAALLMGTLMLVSIAPAQSTAVTATAVPGALISHDAWLRTWVRVDDSFFIKHERNLFEESVGVHFRDLEGAHELFINGLKIGTGGSFAPYKSARPEVFRHKVPVGTLKKGEWNEVVFHVHHEAGKGGFLGEAPFIMNYFMECVLEGPWEFSTSPFTPGPSLKVQPTSSSFSKFRESNRVLGRAEQFHGQSLSPADAYAKMRATHDLTIDLLLSEPLIAQPTHFSFDTRGRLWVTQYRQYPYPAGVSMISRDKYYRSHYDRIPPAPPNHDRGADIVSIHESTKHDGVYDKHTVFQDGLNMANSALRAYGGVWVMNPPYLLFYPDVNGADKPDGPPVVHLAGFGLEDTHSVGNGIVLGPDGWIYGVHGSTSSSRVTRPGFDAPDAPAVHFEGCMVWRYHPKTREYDIFCEGSGNPFGLDFDGDGRMYSGHNGGNTRGWHYVQGGIYLKQGVDPGKFGPARSPYSFGQLPILGTKNPVPRFSHFGTFVEATALAPQYQEHLFSLDPLHNTVTDSERIPQGATYVTADKGIPMWSEDVCFRPLYIANAPDGSLFVSDMYEFYIAHGQHYQNQIDPTTGRLYRLRSKDAKLETDTNLEPKNTAQLVALLGHPNKFHRTASLQLLSERKDPAALPRLDALLAADKGRGALGALWALYQMDALTDDRAVNALRHSFAPVRLWAARFLGDKYGVNRGLGVPGLDAKPARELPSASFAAVMQLARTEPDAEVRAQLASTARRLPTAQMLSLVGALASRDEDAHDAYIPLLLWFALESHVALDRTAVVNFVKEPALWDRPLVQQQLLPRLMRRFATEGRRTDLLVCAQLLRLAPTPAHTVFLMKGFEEAYRGRELAGLPDELLQAMAASGKAPVILRVRQGDAVAIKEALAVIAQKKADLTERLNYVRVFGEVRQAEALDVLLELADSSEPVALRKAALISLMSYEKPLVGPRTVALLAKSAGEVRLAALALLASRSDWSLELLKAIKAGEVAANTVPRDMVDRMRGHEPKQVQALLAELYPKQTVAGVTDFIGKIADVEAKLKAGTGNPYEGEPIFMEKCAPCHKLFFKGGKIGPELTAYQRDNLGTMLISIVNPSAEIREGFQYYSVSTNDGRSLSGFLVERDAQILVLRGLEGEDITLRQADVRLLTPMGRSLMPEGLLDNLSDQQLRNLFAYLRISQPISK
ncbi:MAG: PVC-type heme-binding CxxCH protein [Verrucomicrobiota bacterium]|jgi:putative heme-binding domain-containing protein